jgi:hypothetical protein
LNNLSLRWGDLGRREDALAASDEAVTIHRALAARWPGIYQPQLDGSVALRAWVTALPSVARS